MNMIISTTKLIVLKILTFINRKLLQLLSKQLTLKEHLIKQMKMLKLKKVYQSSCIYNTECLMAQGINSLKTDKKRQMNLQEKMENMMLLLQLLKRLSNSLLKSVVKYKKVKKILKLLLSFKNKKRVQSQKSLIMAKLK